MDKVCVAGYRGMVGSALVRRLVADGIKPWLPPRTDYSVILDAEVAFTGMDTVFFAAGVGGGIAKNQRVPADLACQTLRLLTGGMEGARRAGVQRFVWFACACVYPRDGGALWSGLLEPTSQAFAAAQLAGIELTRAMNQQYRTGYLALVCPTCYGPGDDFSDDGHVVAGLIRAFHGAKVSGASLVTLWGTGRAIRQVMYVDDLARVALAVSHAPRNGCVLNVSVGTSVSVEALALCVKDIVAYKGRIAWRGTEDGAPRKELAGGVWPTELTSLAEGLRRTYEWFLANVANLPTGQNLVTR